MLIDQLIRVFYRSAIKMVYKLVGVVELLFSALRILVAMNNSTNYHEI